MTLTRSTPEWWSSAIFHGSHGDGQHPKIELSDEFKQLFASYDTERQALASLLRRERPEESELRELCSGAELPNFDEIPEGGLWLDDIKHSHATRATWKIEGTDGFFIDDEGELAQLVNKEILRISELSFDTAAEITQVIDAMRAMRQSD